MIHAETQVNSVWLKLILSEMALNYKTGLTHSRAGSPFAQFRAVFPELPKNKKKAMLWVRDLLKHNNIEPGQYFSRTITEIENECNTKPQK